MFHGDRLGYFVICFFTMVHLWFISMDCSVSYSEDDERVNFREFTRTLAHFRPIRKSKDGDLTINSREEKLRCKFK